MRIILNGSWGFMADWDDAMEEAREELGYSEGEYVEDFERLVEVAHEWYDYFKEEEYEDFCIDAHHKYREYLQSDRWKKLRLEVIKRDNFKCQDCNENVENVHHLDYQYLNTDKEKEFCISLCGKCHKKRHKIKTNNSKDEEKKVFKKGLPCPICSNPTELRMTMSGEQYLCPNYAYCGGRIK